MFCIDYRLKVNFLRWQLKKFEANVLLTSQPQKKGSREIDNDLDNKKSGQFPEKLELSTLVESGSIELLMG